ncbi:vitamin K epoxide reductase family protein [Nanoarchaeota archaeon]
MAKKKAKKSTKTGKKKVVKKKRPIKKVKKKTASRPKKTKKATKKKAVKKTTKKTPKKTKPTPKALSHSELKKLKVKAHPIEVALKLIIILSLLGTGVAGYLVYLHYQPEASTICNINEKLNCDVVNKSVYSKFLGIPNSMIGIAGYLFFIIVSIVFLKGYDLSKIHKRLKAKHLNLAVILAAGLGWIFSLYLLYIEKFVLHAYCIFCLASLAIITVIFLVSIASYTQCLRCRNIIKRIHLKSRGKVCRYCQ